MPLPYNAPPMPGSYNKHRDAPVSVRPCFFSCLFRLRHGLAEALVHGLLHGAEDVLIAGAAAQVAGVHGSHVILKTNPNEIVPEEILFEAAKLAAKHSKAKASSHVPVDYCKVSFVKKPSGSKPRICYLY